MDLGGPVKRIHEMMRAFNITVSIQVNYISKCKGKDMLFIYPK